MSLLKKVFYGEPIADSTRRAQEGIRFGFWRSLLISLAVHAGILAILVVLLRSRPVQGVTDERARDVGIALKYQTGQREYYLDEVASSRESPPQGRPSSGPGNPDRLPSQPRLQEILPPPGEAEVVGGLPGVGFQVVGAGSVLQATGAGKGGLEGLLSGGGFGRQPGPAGTASLFGIRSAGHKFVYVFDRSGSMGGVGKTALAFAKTHLIASIQGLEKTQQFQIIFYNERPTIFNPAGQPGRLSFATEENKARAIGFIQSITAEGGTQHDAALLLAIQLRPDVIFFLTDADEPRLSDGKLEQIHQRANGIVIHAIEFGRGPHPGGENFLSRIARQNGGQYVYIDITEALRR